MVGELRFKKGLHIALEAFRRTCEVTPVRLLLVGDARRSDGEFLRNFLEHHSDLAQRVAHVPHVEDSAELARLYGAIDVFLAPSLWEGMPNAVLEAMACECTVVASDAGGIRDLIEQGRTGFVVSRFELDRFPEAVAEVVAGGPELWRAVGRAAREFVVRNHGLAGEVDRCLELYRSALPPTNPS
jgi:glycosyltransferase involved in cell wall biosynthesis